jgi:hypothetical protein
MYIVGTLTSWACESDMIGPALMLIQKVLYRYGRRTVYIGGQVFMGGILGVIGIGSLMILLNFGYNISVGPLCKP